MYGYGCYQNLSTMPLHVTSLSQRITFIEANAVLAKISNSVAIVKVLLSVSVISFLIDVFVVVVLCYYKGTSFVF